MVSISSLSPFSVSLLTSSTEQESEDQTELHHSTIYCCDSETALKNKVHFKQTKRSSRTSVHQGSIRSVTRPAEKRKHREPR